jgi:type IV pilus assembly protein PilF
LKYRFLFIIATLSLLQSCQTNAPAQNETPVKKTKLSDAASYNTQLGLGYLKQGERTRAKSKLFLALSQDPNSPAANAAVGYFMEKSGDMVNADIYYKKAMAISPRSGAQLNNYGTFLCRQGHYKQAETYFLKAVADLEYAHTAGAYENAGLCVLAIPDNTAAASYFVKALEQDPSRAQSLLELVTLEVKQHHTKEALTYLQKYPNLTLMNNTLLKLAIDVAHEAGKTDLEAEYKSHLIGEKQ